MSGLAATAEAPDTGPPVAMDAVPIVRRHLFVIEGLDVSDALLRVLGLFAVQQAQLAHVSFGAAAGRFVVRLEVDGLSEVRAEHLARRLGQLPLVTGVSLGWRG